MNENSPTCSRLLLSWALLIIGIGLIDAYGNRGWLLSLLPIGIAMKIRNAHDKSTMERLRQAGEFPKWIAIYYVLLLVLVCVLIADGIRVDHMSFPVLFLTIAFPIFIVLLTADIGICSKPNEDRDG